MTASLRPIPSDRPAFRLTPAGRRRLRGILWRARFLTAALCLGLAAATIAHHLRPTPPATAPVAVAARPVAVGAQLTAADVRIVRWPSDLVPDDVASSRAQAVGRTAGATLPAGAPLVRALLAGGDLAKSAPVGTVVAPVRLDATVAALLSAGTRVDLIAAGSGTVSVDGAGGRDAGERDAGERDAGERDAGERHADQRGADEPHDAGERDADQRGADERYVARRALVLPGRGSPAADSDPTAQSSIVLVAVRPAEAVALAGLAEGTVSAVIVP